MPGKLRTFGSLATWHQKYMQDGCPHKSMMLYKNVINASLLEEDPEKRVLDVIPPPELHLLMGVNKVFKVNYMYIDPRCPFLWCEECQTTAWAYLCDISYPSVPPSTRPWPSK